MIERFQGADGPRRLIEVLMRQTSIAGNQVYAEAIARVSYLLEYQAGAALITQGGEDDDVFFLLAGEVSIVVNGYEVNRRQAGQHVGEMTLLDPTERRSATVRALTVTVAAKVTESDFTRAAEAHPQLWRRISIDLARRLRERNALVPVRNETPHLFVGCSVEQLDIAREIQLGLAHDEFVVRLWTNGIFGASRFPIDDLEKQVRTSDFAILLNITS